MILSDFLSFLPQGLYCKYGNFFIDPQEPVELAVISHAHGDHAVGGNKQVYCTAPTAAFMQLRYKKNAGNFHITEFNQPVLINGVKVTLFSAGHILGSAQLLLEYNGVSYLYTGDYKLQEDATCEPFKFVNADVLITESTFADPQVKHPDPQAQVKKLNDFKGNILLGAYALGKSQRLIAMINNLCEGKRIMVHHSIMPFNRIYEQFGYRLGAYELYNRKLMKSSQNNIYLVPRFTFESYFRAVGVKRIFASGWKNLQTNENDSLFISDHVDWNDIQTTIAQVKPKEIWTLHGNGTFLQKYYDPQISVKILEPFQPTCIDNLQPIS
jgi:putative mRNA 3-end processing factor